MKAATDGLHRQAKQIGQQRPGNQYDQRPGARRRSESLRQSVVGQQHGEAGAGQAQGGQVYGIGVGRQHVDAGEELSRQIVDLQSEKILDLGKEDNDSDAVGEADHDGDRDEADQLPHARQAHGEQEYAGQHGCAKQIVEAVDGDDAVNDRDEGARRSPICTRSRPAPK
jgi:hypothetical protein